ncbi:hypothetical protein SAMN05216404_11580, partial [Nitrosospira multiformis]
KITSSHSDSPRLAPGGDGSGETALALTGKGWEWVGWKLGKQRDNASRVFVYPPTSPPRRGLGGVVGGLAREAWPVPARLEFKCAATARLCGSQAMTGQALAAGMACDKRQTRDGKFSQYCENLL